MFKSVRFKLITWFFIVLSIILVTFSFLIYLTYRYSQYSRIDGSLQSRAEAVASLINIRQPELTVHFNLSGPPGFIDRIGINFPPQASLSPFIDQARIYGQFIQILDLNGKILEKIQ